jgi:hypothetical protein
MDPFKALGVDAGVSEPELAAAYRKLAKRWHPDHRGDPDRMRELNAAYAEAREQVQSAERRRAAAEPDVLRRPDPGAWLPDAVRRRLGWELLAALAEGERVRLITEAGRSGAGPAKLALTDRRLLWVVEDAVSSRVDWVRFGIVAGVERRTSLLGRRSVLRVRTSTGRRISFGDLAPDTADEIAAVLERRKAAA